MKYLGLILLSLSVVLTGCSSTAGQENGKEEENAEKEEAKSYSKKEKQQFILDFINDDISKIAAQEKKAFASLNSVSGENFTTAEAVYEELTKTAIPEYEKALDMMKELKPKWEELEKPTETMVNAGESFLESLNLEVKAQDQQDPSLREESNAKLDEYYQTIEEYHQELEALSEEYGVVYERK